MRDLSNQARNWEQPTKTCEESSQVVRVHFGLRENGTVMSASETKQTANSDGILDPVLTTGVR